MKYLPNAATSIVFEDFLELRAKIFSDRCSPGMRATVHSRRLGRRDCVERGSCNTVDSKIYNVELCQQTQTKYTHSRSLHYIGFYKKIPSATDHHQHGTTGTNVGHSRATTAWCKTRTVCPPAVMYPHLGIHTTKPFRDVHTNRSQPISKFCLMAHPKYTIQPAGYEAHRCITKIKTS